MVLKFRRRLDRFLLALDSEGVGIFQAIVYLHLAAGGAYCAFIAGGPPDAVKKALPAGTDANTAWLWLCMGATVCMVGKLLSGRPDKRRFWVHTTGLYLQLAGDIFAFGAFGSYVLSTWQTEIWGGKSVIAVWVFFGLADCALLLVARDFRRIEQAERTVRR